MRRNTEVKQPPKQKLVDMFESNVFDYIDDVGGENPTFNESQEELDKFLEFKMQGGQAHFET